MDKRLEIAQAKELRGEIVGRLYEFYSEDISLSTIRNLLKYKKYFSDKDVRRAVCYLSGVDKNYIHVETAADDFWDSLVQLTPIGVNLAEGDIHDLGVLLNEQAN